MTVQILDVAPARLMQRGKLFHRHDDVLLIARREPMPSKSTFEKYHRAYRNVLHKRNRAASATHVLVRRLPSCHHDSGAACRPWPLPYNNLDIASQQHQEPHESVERETG